MANLRVDGSKHCVFIHQDFISSQGQQRAAGHRIVRHKDSHLALMAGERIGNLLGGQNKTARRVQDEVNRQIWVGQFDGAQNLLGVLDVDVSRHGESEEGHAFLAMDQRNDSRGTPGFQRAHQTQTGSFDHFLPDKRHKGCNDQKDPE